jgi:hypothetical protein
MKHVTGKKTNAPQPGNYMYKAVVIKLPLELGKDPMIYITECPHIAELCCQRDPFSMRSTRGDFTCIVILHEKDILSSVRSIEYTHMSLRGCFHAVHACIIFRLAWHHGHGHGHGVFILATSSKGKHFGLSFSS